MGFGGFVVTGGQELLKKLDELIKLKDDPRVAEAYLAGAEIGRDAAKEKVKVVTGETQADIFAVKGPEDAPNAIFGVSLERRPSALDLEFGNHNMAAEPFLRPALIENADKMTEVIGQKMEAILDEI